MLNARSIRRLVVSAALLALWPLWPLGRAWGQALRLDSLPVGLRPLGVDITSTQNRVFVAVGNPGDNTISVFELKRQVGQPPIVPTATIPQVPSPYAVVSCEIDAVNPGRGEQVLVTSPSSNSVTVVQVVEGRVVGTIAVGPHPFSAACFWDVMQPRGVVSLGDNTLAIVDLNSLTVTARIADVPSARALHGIGVYRTRQGNFLAWVAGSDASVVTVVDLGSARVLTRIPVRGPTAVRCCFFVASASDSRVIAFHPETLQATFTLNNVPNPQDFAASGLGTIATAGGSNSIARITNRDRTVSVIPGIPGAAGVAAYSYSQSLAPDTAVVLVTSPDSSSLFLIQAPPFPPTEFLIVDGATFQRNEIAAGALASVFATTGVIQNFFAGSLPLPTTLGGVTLRVGGKLDYVNFRWAYSAEGATPAPLLFVGPRQINFQLPPGIAPGDTVPAQLTRPDGTVLLTTLRVVPSSPGIFTVLMNGQGQAAALNQDNSLNGNPQTMLAARPAARGSVIQIFATGAGATNPPLLPGEAAPISGNPLVLTQAQPTVTIGGKTARVLFSGLAPGFVGLWQINAEVPQDVAPGPAVPLTITAGGIPSNTATIAVQ